jgi:hypothetical protein
MRGLRNWLRTALAILSLASAVFGQDPSASINGPILGFVADSSGSAIQPIRGVLGASVVAQPLVFDFEIRNTVISPKHDYALANLPLTGETVLIQFGVDSITMKSLDGVRGGATVIAVSPNATAAAIYGQDGTLQLIAGLPDSPHVVFDFDVSDLRGHLQSIAVADDGMLALLNFAALRDVTLWAVSANGSRWNLPAQRPSAASFLSNRHDVVIADDAAQEVFLLSNIDQEASRLSVASFGEGFNAFSGVAASADGLRVFISSKKSETVTVVELETGLSTVLACDCRTTGFRPLKGTSVFQLSDPADGPVAVLDASSPEPRIIILPVVSEVIAPTLEEVRQQ